MNLILIDKAFKKLNLVEDYINYKFEPRSQDLKGKRHVYYNDIKNDFVDEVNAYGFSPFIKETYDCQRKDKNIMRFKCNFVNEGLLNYVKKKNKNKVRKRNKANGENITIENIKVTEGVNANPATDVKKRNKNQKEDFLQKALENLARNKLNISEESIIFQNDENELVKEKNGNKSNDQKSKRSTFLGNKSSMYNNKPSIFETRNVHASNTHTLQRTVDENSKNIDKMKEKIVSALNLKEKLDPIASVSDVSQAEPVKVSLGRFFSNVNAFRRKSVNQSGDGYKKIVGLFKKKLATKPDDSEKRDIVNGVGDTNVKLDEDKKLNKITGNNLDKTSINGKNEESIQLNSIIKMASDGKKGKLNFFKNLINLAQNNKQVKENIVEGVSLHESKMKKEFNPLCKENLSVIQDIDNLKTPNNKDSNTSGLKKTTINFVQNTSINQNRNFKSPKAAENEINKNKHISLLYLESINKLNSLQSLPSPYMYKQEYTNHQNEEIQNKIIESSPYSLIERIKFNKKETKKSGNYLAK